MRTTAIRRLTILIAAAIIFSGCARQSGAVGKANDLVQQAAAKTRQLVLCHDKVTTMAKAFDGVRTRQELQRYIRDASNKRTQCLQELSNAKGLMRQALALNLSQTDMEYVRLIDAAVSAGYDTVSFAYDDVWYVLQDLDTFLGEIEKVSALTPALSAVAQKAKQESYGEARSELAELKTQVGHLMVRSNSLAKRETTLQGYADHYGALDSLITNFDRFAAAMQEEDWETAIEIEGQIRAAQTELQANMNPTFRVRDFAIVKKLEERKKQYDLQVMTADEYAAKTNIALERAVLPLLTSP